MAYFDCIVGGSGKGNTLVVTCADDLAGATITCTNGTKTYTKTCPSTAPYEVTFYGLAAGTYTVSATVSGNTYTTTVVITDYEAELGGFSWKSWVNLSENYASSDFTDLDDLLSDETAVRELMTIHACVDYLAGIAAESPDVETIIGNDLCAKWINNRDYALDTLYANEIIAGYMDTADKYFYGEWVIIDDTTTPPTWGAKGNVPVMTSNTAPYGECISNGTDGTAHNAFDNNDSTESSNSSYGTSGGQRLGYKFTNPVNVKKLHHTSAAGATDTIKIQYSDNGTTWTDTGDTFTNTASVSGGKDVDVTDSGYHLYWAIYCTGSTITSRMSTRTLQFYGRELSVSVPTMTSNTAPYGEVTVSSYYQSGYEGFRAFDATNGGWNPASSDSVNNANLVYKFTDYVNPVMFGGSGARDAASSGTNTVKLLVSKDGQTWVDTTKSVVIDRYTLTKVFNTVSLTDGYKYFKFLITAVDNMSIAGGWGNKFFLYGKDYSEKEFEEGTTKKWLYDHGLFLGITDFDKIGTGGTVEKTTEKVKVAKTSSTSSADVYIHAVSHEKVDFSENNIMFAKCLAANTNANNTSIVCPGISANKTSSYNLGGYVARNNIINGGPLSYIDISAINEADYVSIGTGYSTYLGYAELFEMWLE